MQSEITINETIVNSLKYEHESNHQFYIKIFILADHFIIKYIGNS